MDSGTAGWTGRRVVKNAARKFMLLSTRRFFELGAWCKAEYGHSVQR